MDKRKMEERQEDVRCIDKLMDIGDADIVRGITFKCDRCNARKFFALSAPDKLEILNLICSECGLITSTGVEILKISAKTGETDEAESYVC
jgi:transcription elongation factor Elf1